MLSGHDRARPVGGGPRDPGARPSLRRRGADPWEVHAEEHDIPDDARAKHHRLAKDLGLFAMNMPKDLGGGFTMLQQVLVSEQIGRVTNALGWCVHTARVGAGRLHRRAARALDPPSVRGERRVLRDHEEGAGSDVDAIASTARRDGDDYVLNGTKMHVTSYNSADWIFFQAKLAGGDHEGEHALLRREGHAGRPADPRASLHLHLSPTRTRSSRSRTSACRPRTSWARRATGCRSPTSGSATSG